MFKTVTLLLTRQLSCKNGKIFCPLVAYLVGFWALLLSVSKRPLVIKETEILDLCANKIKYFICERKETQASQRFLSSLSMILWSSSRELSR